MRNKYFLIWCISVFIISTLDNYLSFISGHTLWRFGFYDRDTIAVSTLIELIIISMIGYILYEPKE